MEHVVNKRQSFISADDEIDSEVLIARNSRAPAVLGLCQDMVNQMEVVKSSRGLLSLTFTV